MEQEKNKCIIIAAAPNTNYDYMRNYISENDYVICADGGLSVAEDLNIKPDLIVGDFDSYIKEVNYDNVIKLSVMKDDTDTLSAVKYGIEKGYSDFILLNAIGGRFDHTYANIAILEFLKSKNCTGKILTEREEIFLLCNTNVKLSNLKNKTISVFPFGCDNIEVSYKGMLYPLDGEKIYSHIPIGVSNVAISDDAEISIIKGKGIVVINR